MTATVQAAGNVGVNVGDSAQYSGSIRGNFTGMANYDATVTLTVKAISGPTGTNITLKEDIYNITSGATSHSVGSVDVDTGEGNMTGTIILANLNAPDLVYTGPWSMAGINWTGATINETIPRQYLGSTVQVNHLNITQTGTIYGYIYLRSFNVYWYKASGWVAELSFGEWIKIVNVMYWYSMHYIIIATVPEFPPAIIPSLFMVLTLIAVVFVKRGFPRNHKTKF
jgi:hypothetical protein